MKFNIEKMEFKLFGFITVKIPQEVVAELFAKLRMKIIKKKGISAEMYDTLVKEIMKDLYN